MVALVVIVLDERLDLGFEVAGQEVVFQQDAVLRGLMPALDLALGLGMERGAAHMAHALGFDIIRQFACDVAGTIVAEQPGPVGNMGLVTARCRQRQCWPEVERRASGSLRLGFRTLRLPIYASWRSKQPMIITTVLAPGLTIERALDEANSEGFVGDIQEYAAGHPEPHQHDYRVRLFVLKGEIMLTDAQDNVVYACRCGTRAYVSAGTALSKDHDTLKMIVARRNPRSSIEANP